MMTSPENKHIAFISTMAALPWAGSEELWCQAAATLCKEGFSVFASVAAWSPLHERALELARGGVAVWPRASNASLWLKARRRLAAPEKTDQLIDVEKFISRARPRLVVFSAGVLPPIDLLEFCGAERIRFVTISHVNSRDHWLNDDLTERYRRILPKALRCYFVSKASLETAGLQLGSNLNNGEIVSNPFNIDFDVSIPWPVLADASELRLACVGRLHPPSKGQDILIEALAGSRWANRNWRLTLYGDGPMRNILERFVQRFSMSERVNFGGYIPPKQIWTDNHALVMTSRYESLPLAVIEAMLCGRPVLATDVGGHAEVIEDGVTGFLAESATVPAVQRSLERLWGERLRLREIGSAAAKRIRQIVPADPVGVFTEKLKSLL